MCVAYKSNNMGLKYPNTMDTVIRTKYLKKNLNQFYNNQKRLFQSPEMENNGV